MQHHWQSEHYNKIKIGNTALSVAAPCAYNWMPTKLRLVHSAPSFKRHLRSLFVPCCTNQERWITTVDCWIRLHSYHHHHHHHQHQHHHQHHHHQHHQFIIRPQGSKKTRANIKQTKKNCEGRTTNTICYCYGYTRVVWTGHSLTETAHCRQYYE